MKTDILQADQYRQNRITDWDKWMKDHHIKLMPKEEKKEMPDPGPRWKH